MWHRPPALCGHAFICRGKPAAVVVPLNIASRARHRGISSGPAGRPSDLGAEGHGFFSRRISPAMHKGCGRAVPKPCSLPGLDTVCMTVEPSQLDSIVTVLVSESVWERYNIFWFRSNPSPAARERYCTGPQPTGPVVHRFPQVCHSTQWQADRMPRRCGSRGSSPVCGPHFPGVHAARDQFSSRVTNSTYAIYRARFQLVPPDE